MLSKGLFMLKPLLKLLLKNNKVIRLVNSLQFLMTQQEWEQKIMNAI